MTITFNCKALILTRHGAAECRQTWKDIQEFNDTSRRSPVDRIVEPSRAVKIPKRNRYFVGGSVSEFCELSGEGRGRKKEEG
jgi:hypothetical protein